MHLIKSRLKDIKEIKITSLKFHYNPHVTSFTILANCQRAARAGLPHEGQPQHHILPSRA